MRWLGLVSALVVVAGCRGDTTMPSIDGGDGADVIGGGMTIYDIQTPGGSASTIGTPVDLGGVIVTAVDRFGNRVGGLWIQEPAGGPYSGVFVFNPAVSGGTIDDIQPGDIVDLAGGVVDEFALATDTTGRTLTEIAAPMGGVVTVTKTGTGQVPAPADVDATLIGSDDAEAEKWEGVLIRVSNVAVTLAPSGVSSTDPTLAEMTVTGPWRVGSSLTALLTAPPENAPLYLRDACFTSITGVGDYFFNYKALPRDAADLVLAADMSSCLYEDSVEECHDGSDDDFDGFTDCADFSCQAADPTCISDTTINDVQMGVVAPGTAVRLTDVIVTARAQRLLWIQEPAGGPYSGVAVFSSGGISTDLAPGDIVTVEGNVTEFMGTGDPDSVTEITNPVITETGTGPVPAPAMVTIAELASAATAEPWEGVLVQTDSATIVTPATVATFGEWTVSDGTNMLLVDDAIYTPYMLDMMTGELVGPGAGTCYSFLIGPFHYSFGAYKIEPREAADLGGACP